MSSDFPGSKDDKKKPKPNISPCFFGNGGASNTVDNVWGSEASLELIRPCMK